MKVMSGFAPTETQIDFSAGVIPEELPRQSALSQLSLDLTNE